jgi:16S rRNA (cytosine1402-N4)-methyltransferase
MTSYGHISVLLQESIDGLDIHPGNIFVDGTLGSAGHSEEVAKRYGSSVRIIGIDMDEDALSRAEQRFSKLDANYVFVQSNFRNIDTVLKDLSIDKVDRILLDIGLSSNQFEESGRGFSFQRDEPLTMTFKKSPGENDLTAQNIVNEWSEETLRVIIKNYGEEQFAYKIAKSIVEIRKENPISTTMHLLEIIKNATPGWYHHRKTHYATKTFQALRIAVNDELQALQEGLRKGFERLHDGGRIAVISFHSLEDRIVKNFFKQRVLDGEATLLTKKPQVPSDKEIEENRRSRSAKLRVLVKK